MKYIKLNFIKLSDEKLFQRLTYMRQITTPPK